MGPAAVERHAITVRLRAVSRNARRRDQGQSLRPYWGTLRLLLDYGDVAPNPSRDKRIKLPSVVSEEINPSTAKQFLAILDHVAPRFVLTLIAMEQTAMRVGEGSRLTWGDVDVAESRFLLRRATTKTKRARWVQVPTWLMDAIAATCPLEDRTSDRRVFTGLTENAVRNAMRRACQSAGIPHFHPHDLRHRRTSLWHVVDGVPARELADRAGHSRASMSLDVYSHVLVDTADADTAELLSRCGPREA